MINACLQIFKTVLPFALVGVISGLVSTATWDIDDNGLLLVTLPGWLFAIGTSVVFLSQTRSFGQVITLKLLAWSVFTGGCFFASAYMVIQGLDYRSHLVFILPGFITTFVMVFFFRSLISFLTIVDMLKVSILAGGIAYISIRYFILTDIFAILFMPYHILVGGYFGYLISKKNRI